MHITQSQNKKSFALGSVGLITRFCLTLNLDLNGERSFMQGPNLLINLWLKNAKHSCFALRSFSDSISALAVNSYLHVLLVLHKSAPSLITSAVGHCSILRITLSIFFIWSLSVTQRWYSRVLLICALPPYQITLYRIWFPFLHN